MNYYRDNDKTRLLIGFVAIALGLVLMIAMDIKDIINIFTKSEDENIESYSTIEEVADRLQSEIMKGSQSFTFYGENISSDDISQINNMIDPTYGTAANQESFMLYANSKGDTKHKITLETELTPAYYVYAHVVQGKEIPADNPDAMELWKATRKVLSLVNDDMSDYKKELKIHDYLVKNCKYSETLTHSQTSNIYNAYGALVEKTAVCDGYAQAMQLLLSCAGVTSMYVSGTATSGSETMNHAWNMVQLKDNWYHLDTTWDDPVPDMGNLSTHAYFNVADDYISGSHTWDTEKYPKADSKEFNYYTKTKQRFSNWKKYKKASYKALAQEKEPIYEAYIGKRKVKTGDFQFLYKKLSDFKRQYNWLVIEEPKGNVIILTASKKYN